MRKNPFLFLLWQADEIGDRIDKLMDEENKTFAYIYKFNYCSAEKRENAKIIG